MESSAAALDAVIARHAHRDGPLLPILRDVQAEFGCIDEFAKRHIAHALNVSRADVHGVVSFYHDFRELPAPRPVIRLCRAESCQARGVEALAARATERAGDRVEIETVYCLGLCSVGPAAMIGDRVYGRLDEAKLAALMAEV